MTHHKRGSYNLSKNADNLSKNADNLSNNTLNLKNDTKNKNLKQIESSCVFNKENFDSLKKHSEVIW